MFAEAMIHGYVRESEIELKRDTVCFLFGCDGFYY